MQLSEAQTKSLVSLVQLTAVRMQDMLGKLQPEALESIFAEVQKGKKEKKLFFQKKKKKFFS